MKEIRTELVEITVTNTGVNEFSLGSLPNLRRAKRIIRIEALRFSLVPVSPSGKATVNNAVFDKSYLRLISSENVEYRALALQTISKTVNGTEIPELNTDTIDPEKSKIVVGSVAGLVANESFLLQVTYEK